MFPSLGLCAYVLTIGVNHCRVGVDRVNRDLAGCVCQIRHSVCFGQADLLDNRRLGKSRPSIFSASILNEENFVCGRIPHHRLMKQGVFLRASNERQSWVAANDCIELVVVDVEWLGEKVSVADTWRLKDLSGIDHGGRQDGRQDIEDFLIDDLCLSGDVLSTSNTGGGADASLNDQAGEKCQDRK